jgi:hypothetical protein
MNDEHISKTKTKSIQPGLSIKNTKLFLPKKIHQIKCLKKYKLNNI